MGPILKLAAGRYPANTRKARVVDAAIVLLAARTVKRPARPGVAQPPIWAMVAPGKGKASMGKLTGRRLSGWLAIAVGAIVVVAQLYRNWGNWGSWMTWTVDEVAALALIGAGVSALRRPVTRLLPVAWAFACGLWVAGAIIHFNSLPQVPGEHLAHEKEISALLAGLAALTAGGLALVMLDRRNEG